MVSFLCYKELSAPSGHSRSSHCLSFAIWPILGKSVERFFGKTRVFSSISHYCRIHTGRLLHLMPSLFGKLFISLQWRHFRLTAWQASGRDSKSRGETTQRVIYHSYRQLFHYLEDKRFREYPGATAKVVATKFADCSCSGSTAVLRPDPHKTIP